METLINILTALSFLIGGVTCTSLVFLVLSRVSEILSLICQEISEFIMTISELLLTNCQFVARCSAASFKTARMMLKGIGPESQIVTIKPSKSKPIAALGLPKTLTVRFVRVMLDTGKYEVLVTSERNEQVYPSAEFKEIYAQRWGIETFYGVLKTRLELENLTGKTAESVKQDFYAAVYITGLESILTLDANEQLEQRKTQHNYQVNQAVSFNAIKNHVIELLYSESNLDQLLEKLTKLLSRYPTSVRKNRQVPRQKSSDKKIIHFHKRLKKACF